MKPQLMKTTINRIWRPEKYILGLMRRHAYPNLTAGDLFRFFRIWKSVGLESSIRGTGKIVEDGGYDQLIELNGRFAELVERRQLDI